MTDIVPETEEKTQTQIIEEGDGHGNMVQKEETVTQTYLYITFENKNAEEMSAQYAFDGKQRQLLSELLSEKYDSLWAELLYGTAAGNGALAAVALSQEGNVGGRSYWLWYGFTVRVEWCACFVSWCANECGYIDSGVIPKFSGCANGAQWFRERG